MGVVVLYSINKGPKICIERDMYKRGTATMALVCVRVGPEPEKPFPPVVYTQEKKPAHTQLFLGWAKEEQND